MAEFPAPADGLLLTYLVVSRDVARSRRFYTANDSSTGRRLTCSGQPGLRLSCCLRAHALPAASF